jgi:hypothetical protein
MAMGPRLFVPPRAVVGYFDLSQSSDSLEVLILIIATGRGLRLNEYIEADERCSPTPARWDSKAFSNGRSYRDRRELISLLGARRAHGRIKSRLFGIPGLMSA